MFPGARVDVVTQVERDFSKQGHCDHHLIAVIEEALRKRLHAMVPEDKRGIWVSLGASGAINDTDDFDDYPEGSIDMTLEGELMYLITDRLSPPNKRSAANRTMIMKKCRPTSRHACGDWPAILTRLPVPPPCRSRKRLVQPRVADLRRHEQIDVRYRRHLSLVRIVRKVPKGDTLPQMRPQEISV